MRIHLRKKHIISKKNIFIFTLILIFISLVFIINFIGNKITPGVVSYAETELEKFTTRIINSVISTEIKDISLEEKDYELSIHFLKTYTNNRAEDQLFQMLYAISIDQIVDDKTLRIWVENDFEKIIKWENDYFKSS